MIGWTEAIPITENVHLQIKVSAPDTGYSFHAC